MKANELRIGNLLSFSGEPVAINAGFIHDCDYWNKNPERQDAVSFENVEPVPLTDEWLERFGFEKDEESSSWSKIVSMPQFDYCFEISNKYQEFFQPDFLSIDIKYVHQLQNLYFALTGKELTIKEDKL